MTAGLRLTQAILKAAKGGKLEACKMLTERGADAHLYNKNRQNAFDAATLGRHTDCLHLLQPSDADKQAKDPTMKLTPLMEACHKGDLQQVEELCARVESRMSWKEVSRAASIFEKWSCHTERISAKVVAGPSGPSMHWTGVRPNFFLVRGLIWRRERHISPGLWIHCAQGPC